MTKSTIAQSSLLLLLAVALSLSCGGPAPQPETQSAEDRREAAYRANNRGVALLEQFAYEQAVDAFREAVQIDPSLRLVRINLPIALYYASRTQEAQTAATAARAEYPDAPQPPYLLGLIARAQNQLDDAAAAFARVLELDPDDVGAKVNLALVDVQQRKYAEAADLCRSALALEPYNATAAYNLGLALTRAGDRAAGARALQQFEELRTAPYAITYSQTYLEQGRYAEAAASTGAEPDLVSSAAPALVFADATAALVDASANQTPAAAPELPAPLAGSVTLADLDGDGDLDVISTGPAVRILRNDRTRLVDVTRELGLAGIAAPATGAAAADFNNDLRTDLLLITVDGPRLFSQGQDGSFRDVDARLPAAALRQTARTAAFVDVDHDGDVDILIGGLTQVPPPSTSGWSFLRASSPTSSRLLRNNGNGTFQDITAAAGLGEASAVVALAPTDFDNRRDIDILTVPYGARPKLFKNLRTGSFADVAPSVGLPDVGPYTSLAVGDMNKDGFTDAFFGQESAPGIWALSDGRGRFRLEPGPVTSQGAIAAQIIDYDNDGLLDLFIATAEGPRVFRHMGRAWQEETDRAISAEVREASRGAGTITAIAAGDLDLDGDVDVVAHLRNGSVRVWRNDGGNQNRSLRVKLTGRVSNRSAVGAKVEVRAGRLHQKLETTATTPSTVPADLVFGLGRRSAADIVRVLWPAGILQAESAPTAAATSSGMSVLELNRKPSSCPYLFTWNGSRFEFVTDFLGGGEMGYLEEPGVRNVPYPVEYVRITDQQLRAQNGRLEIRVTNELEEVLFADQLELLAVTHPADVSVFPDEGLRATPRPFRLYAVRESRTPAAATDDHGHDVLPQLSHLDRRYADDFELLPIRGYARAHTLTLDLPPGPNPTSDESTVLLLTGWTDYAFSTDNVAAHQAGLKLSAPVLQVQDAAGRWQTVDPDIGIPVGRPQTLVVDVSRHLPKSRRLRIATNMRVYWDQVLVGTATKGSPLKIETTPRRSASLRWRGFSAEVTPDGREPFGYDYSTVLVQAPWKLMPGRYTREGDVGELIAAADDRFAISRTGDELALSFDASALLPLPPNSRRTFLLHGVGFSKEMDLNSASPDEVAPIPFRAMSRYPYRWPERYPHMDDLERFHTRAVSRSIPLLAP
jgi:Tfp pilus assembly protein PilF